MLKAGGESIFDVFVSYASEDRETIARPLVEALRAHGFSVWFDDYTIGAGDNLEQAITAGVRNARYGVIIISRSYLEKDWPRREMLTLWMHETRVERTVVLPVLHGLSSEEVVAFDHAFDNRSMPSTDRGLDYVIDRISTVIHRDRGADVAPIGSITPTKRTWWSVARDVTKLPLNAAGIAPELRGALGALKIALVYNAGIFAALFVDTVALSLNWRLVMREAQLSWRDVTMTEYVWLLVAMLTLIYVWVRLVWSIRKWKFAPSVTISVLYSVTARWVSVPLSAVMIRQEFPSIAILANVSRASVMVISGFTLLFILWKAAVKVVPRLLQRYVHDTA